MGGGACIFVGTLGEKVSSSCFEWEVARIYFDHVGDMMMMMGGDDDADDDNRRPVVSRQDR